MKTFKKEIIYNFKYQLSIDDKYKVTYNGIIFNTKTNREIKKSLIGYTLGYWIGRKFISELKIEDYYEQIERLTLKKAKELYPNIFT